MDDDEFEKFNKIKSELHSNAEVVRFLVNEFYKELIQKGALIGLTWKFIDTLADIDLSDVIETISAIV